MPDEVTPQRQTLTPEQRAERLHRKRLLEALRSAGDMTSGKIDRTLTRLTRTMTALTKLRQKARRIAKRITELQRGEA